MTTAEEIAEAVWSYHQRSLSPGVPGAPANQAEEIAEAVWDYSPRTVMNTGTVSNLQIG